MGIEITKRTDSCTNILRLFYPLLKEENIPTKVKVINKTILRPVLTYYSESWTLSTKLKNKLQAAEMRVLRLIKGVAKRDHRRIIDVQREPGAEPIITFVEKNN